jgi:hypothetical protein
MCSTVSGRRLCRENWPRDGYSIRGSSQLHPFGHQPIVGCHHSRRVQTDLGTKVGVWRTVISVSRAFVEALKNTNRYGVYCQQGMCWKHARETDISAGQPRCTVARWRLDALSLTPPERARTGRLTGCTYAGSPLARSRTSARMSDHIAAAEC